MIFGVLDVAERAARMPEWNFEHPKSKHEGYVAIKKALTAAYTSDFCAHAEAVCGENIKEELAKINVCMWEKKGAGNIENPSIVFGYPRYIREVDTAIVLDDFIHYHIRNFCGEKMIIYWDNNLYIKETAEPYSEDVIMLAALYYIAHLRGKLEEMRVHLKAAIQPIYEKTLYVPAPRAEYNMEEILTQARLDKIKANGNGVDIREMRNTIEKLDAEIRMRNQEVIEKTQKKEQLNRDLMILLENPRVCPALETVNEILKQLADQTVGIKFTDNEIRFTLESFITDFNKAEFVKQWDNKHSNLNEYILSFNANEARHRNVRFDNEDYKKFVKTLFKKVFIDEEYKLLVTSTFVLNLYPLNYTWESWRETTASPTGYTNPHLFWYVCWAEAQSAIARCFENRNYEQIPLYLKSALEQVTLQGDNALMYTAHEFYVALTKNNPARVFVDKDGYAYSIKELYEMQ